MNLETAIALDQNDPLQKFRTEFSFPKQSNGEDFLYFCGNSLGLQAKSSAVFVNNELNKWQKHGVEGHFTAPNPWLSYHKNFEYSIARLVGAQEKEVVTMNALTVNLNLLLLSFYQPCATKYKILLEKNAFPSDQYAVKSQIDLSYKKGVLSSEQAKTALVYIEPNELGVYGTERILETLNQEDIALVLLSGVNYQTGEKFELEKISQAAQSNNITIGLDLAHAIGNIPLNLHYWNIDFAVWCTYKYLNGGPGSVGGAFIHSKHLNNSNIARLHGWWSNKESNRFEMKQDLDVYESAEAWQMSNAPILSMASLMGSLSVFDQVDLDEYYKKGEALSSFLAGLIQTQLKQVSIITPLDAKGCQLSILIKGKGKAFIEELQERGVIADWRNHPKGGILRLAPVPLYNSFEDCWRLVEILRGFV
jgi:kynureninase